MQVVARCVDLSEAPVEIAPLLTPGQVFVTAGQKYAVFALAVFEGRTTLQVIDDLNGPAWLPACLFDVTDSVVSSDWICSLFRDDPVLVAGPAFVAQDQAAHARMVGLEAHEVDLFWKRVQALTDEEDAQGKVAP